MYYFFPNISDLRLAEFINVKLVEMRAERSKSQKKNDSNSY